MKGDRNDSQFWAEVDELGRFEAPHGQNHCHIFSINNICPPFYFRPLYRFCHFMMEIEIYACIIPTDQIRRRVFV